MLIVTAKEGAVTPGAQHVDPEGTMARQGSSMEAAVCVLLVLCWILCTRVCARTSVQT